MIHYAIQCLGRDVGHMRWLLPLLDHGKVSISVWYDGDIGALPAEPLCRYSPVCWRPSDSLTYRAYSLADGMLRSMRAALETDPSWTWFINLSGACAPLKPQDHVLAFLETSRRQGKLNHIQSFRVNDRDREFGLAAMRETEYRRMSFSRPEVFCERELGWIYENEDVNPISNVDVRVKIHVTEIAGLRRLYVRRLLPEERTERLDFFTFYPLHGGRAWYILHRDTCEALLKGLTGLGSPFRAVFSHCWTPNESLIQTYIRNDPKLLPITETNDNQWYRSGAPNLLGDDCIDGILASNALFARKISMQARRLRGIIEQMAAPRTAPSAAVP